MFFRLIKDTEDVNELQEAGYINEVHGNEFMTSAPEDWRTKPYPVNDVEIKQEGGTEGETVNTSETSSAPASEKPGVKQQTLEEMLSNFNKPISGAQGIDDVGGNKPPTEEPVTSGSGEEVINSETMGSPAKGPALDKKGRPITASQLANNEYVADLLNRGLNSLYSEGLLWYSNDTTTKSEDYEQHDDAKMKRVAVLGGAVLSKYGVHWGLEGLLVLALIDCYGPPTKLAIQNRRLQKTVAEQGTVLSEVKDLLQEMKRPQPAAEQERVRPQWTTAPDEQVFGEKIIKGKPNTNPVVVVTPNDVENNGEQTIVREMNPKNNNSNKTVKDGSARKLPLRHPITGQILPKHIAAQVRTGALRLQDVPEHWEKAVVE